MATEIKMPQLGESVVEGTITKWLKQEGDSVDEDELLVEVSTDKVDSEIPSSAGGVIQKILVQEGETVKVGTPIAVVGEDGAEAAEPEAADSEGEAAPKADEGKDAQARGDEAEEAVAEAGEGESGAAAEEAGQAEETGATREAERDREPAATAKGDEQPEPARAEGDTSKRGIISPLVRRLADQHGVNLDEVTGTGTGGRIRKQDILRHLEEGKEEPAAAAEEAAG